MLTFDLCHFSQEGARCIHLQSDLVTSPSLMKMIVYPPYGSWLYFFCLKDTHQPRAGLNKNCLIRCETGEKHILTHTYRKRMEMDIQRYCSTTYIAQMHYYLDTEARFLMAKIVYIVINHWLILHS